MQPFLLELHGSDATEPTLSSLREWLTQERLDGVRVEAAASAPTAGHMGVDPLMALSIVLGSKAAVELFRSITAWIEHRKPRVKIKVKTAVGLAEIEAENLDGLGASVRAALRLVEPQ